MKTRFFNLGLKFLLVTFYFLLLTPHVNAQSFSLSLTPPAYEIVSPPGKLLTVPYTLTNLGDPQTLKLTVYTLKVNESSGSFALESYDNATNSIFFEVNPTVITLDTPFFIQSKQTLNFNLQILLPEGVEEKDYYFTVVAEKVESSSAEGSTVINLEGGLGSNILISIIDNDSLELQGRISTFAIKPTYSFTLFGREINIVDSFKSVPVILEVVNKGKNVVKSSAQLMTSWSSEDPLKTDNPQYVMSNSQRQLFFNQGTEEFIDNQYSAVLPGNLIGNYTLSAQVQFTNLNHPDLETSPSVVYSTTSFLVFPVTITLIIFSLFVLSLIVILFYLRTKELANSQ